MSRIPEARAKLENLANRLKANPCTLLPYEVAIEIDKIIPMLWREKFIRKAPIKRKAVTCEIRDAVKNYANSNHTDNLQEIGQRFEIDGGRVSEILHGKYDHLQQGEIAKWT